MWVWVCVRPCPPSSKPLQCVVCDPLIPSSYPTLISNNSSGLTLIGRAGCMQGECGKCGWIQDVPAASSAFWKELSLVSTVERYRISLGNSRIRCQPFLRWFPWSSLFDSPRKAKVISCRKLSCRWADRLARQSQVARWARLSDGSNPSPNTLVCFRNNEVGPYCIVTIYLIKFKDTAFSAI
jgi:hypothetical protein